MMMTNMQAIIIMTIQNQVVVVVVLERHHVDASCSTVGADIYAIVVKRIRRNDTCDTISDGNAENCQRSVVRIVNIVRNDEIHSKVI